ncbi:DUF5753 domain-containing protein [Streptomyces californicus]|uniref:DUF5753 domain-containing protein n=1 Tax=Streptomyces californicus TaxID=67351 RepID=UPI0037A7763E
MSGQGEYAYPPSARQVVLSRARSGPTVALRLLAADLQARRVAAGITADAAAASLGVHTMTLSRLEQAHTVPKPATVSHLLRLYGAPEAEVDAALAALSEAKQPGWWHPWRDVLPEHLAGVIDLESAADLIRAYAPAVVPELLQTPGYARSMLLLHHPQASPDEIDRRLELLRVRQQQVLRRPGRTVMLWALVEEVVLRRRVGSRSDMAEQVEYLDRFTRDRSSGITVQVIRAADGPHPLLLSGATSILRYDHAPLADRLVIRGLHPEAAILTEDPSAISTYLTAMDATAVIAPSPSTPLDRILNTEKDPADD